MIRRHRTQDATDAHAPRAFDDVHEWALSLPWVVERPYSVATPWPGTYVGTYTDHEHIGGFYRDVVLAGQAHVDFGAVLADGPLVMAEITGSSPLDPNAKAYAIDVFRLDTDGRIARLDIYYR